MLFYGFVTQPGNIWFLKRFFPYFKEDYYKAFRLKSSLKIKNCKEEQEADL